MSSSTRKKTDTREVKIGTKEYHFDLRQDVCWNLYIDQRSDTFNNAYQSAVKAGYSTNTAKRISAEAWWLRRVRLLQEMLPKAEEILLEDMEMDTTEEVVVGEEIKSKIDPQLRRIRSDSAKFIASTIGRNKYHTKTEVENSGVISLTSNEHIDKLFER